VEVLVRKAVDCDAINKIWMGSSAELCGHHSESIMMGNVMVLSLNPTCLGITSKILV
jgi:hypothetical protein